MRGYVEGGDSAMTRIPGVFAGEDIRRGAAAAILVIGDTKQAAAVIDQYLSSETRP